MDQSTTNQLAEILAEKLMAAEWTRIILLILLTAIAAAVGSFFGRYLQTKGEHFATKEDFDSLTEQLHHNTALVEEVKSEVGYKDWMKREWVNLQRIKLEELLQKLHESERFLDRVQHHAIAGKMVTESSAQPSDVMDSIASLYFPEIEGNVMSYSQLCKRDFVAALQLFGDVSPYIQTGNHQAIEAVVTKYRQQTSTTYPERLLAISNLKKSIRQHLKVILQIEG